MKNISSLFRTWHLFGQQDSDSVQSPLPTLPHKSSLWQKTNKIQPITDNSQQPNTTPRDFFTTDSPYSTASPENTSLQPFKIAIIGGMGPEASEKFYHSFTHIQRILGASKDSDYMPLVLENDPSIPDRTAFLLHNGDDPKPKLQGHLNTFKDPSKKVCLVGAVCNTFHADRICGDLQRHNPDMPIFNLVTATQIFIKANYPGRQIGLLATDGTIQADIYNSGSKIIPDPAYQCKTMLAIYAIKAGYHEKDMRTSENRRALLATLQEHPNTREIARNLTMGDMKHPTEWLTEVTEHLQAKGADVVIMGCTEIPLALTTSHTQVPLVDTIKVLALSLVLSAHNPELKQYVQDHYGKKSWHYESVLSHAYRVLADDIDLTKHSPELSDFMAGKAAERSVTSANKPETVIAGRDAILERLDRHAHMLGLLMLQEKSNRSTPDTHKNDVALRKVQSADNIYQH